MRSDMCKVIVERPRPGSSRHVPRRFRRLDWTRVVVDEDASDPLPAQIGHGRAAELCRHTKHLNENLAPLRRWLAKQVGRRWDDVWSEISAHVSASNPVQQHVRDHIADFVAYRTCVIAGELCEAGNRWLGPRPVATSHRDLYVDPVTGVLCRNTARRRHRAEARRKAGERRRALAQRMRAIDATCQLHLLADGNWWEISLAPVPKGEIISDDGRRRSVSLPFVDVVLRSGLSDLPPADLYDRPDVYAAAKRPLASREIRALGLRQPDHPAAGRPSRSAKPARRR